MGTKGGAEVMLVPSPKPQEERTCFFSTKKMRTLESPNFGSNNSCMIPWRPTKKKHRGFSKKPAAASNGPKKAKINACLAILSVLATVRLGDFVHL